MFIWEVQELIVPIRLFSSLGMKKIDRIYRISSNLSVICLIIICDLPYLIYVLGFLWRNRWEIHKRVSQLFYRQDYYYDSLTINEIFFI